MGTNVSEEFSTSIFVYEGRSTFLPNGGTDAEVQKAPQLGRPPWTAVILPLDDFLQKSSSVMYYCLCYLDTEFKFSPSKPTVVQIST
jgi:hypothetical protein